MGREIIEKGSLRGEASERHLAGIGQAPGRHLGGIGEASGRHLGGNWESLPVIHAVRSPSQSGGSLYGLHSALSCALSFNTG